MYGFIFEKLKTFGRGPGPQDYKISTPAARRRCHFKDQSFNNDPKLFPGLKVKLRTGLGSEIVTAGQKECGFGEDASAHADLACEKAHLFG